MNSEFARKCLWMGIPDIPIDHDVFGEDISFAMVPMRFRGAEAKDPNFTFGNLDRAILNGFVLKALGEDVDGPVRGRDRGWATRRFQRGSNQ